MKINKKRGITLIELIIAMAILSIIGVAIVGLSSSIVRSYSAVNYKTTSRDMATITMQTIRDEIVTADQVSIAASIDNAASDDTYQIYVDGNGNVMHKKGIEAPTTTISAFGNSSGNSKWTMDVVFRKIANPANPTEISTSSLEIEVLVRDPGGNDHSFITQVYLPNVSIHDSTKFVTGVVDEGGYLSFTQKDFS